MTISLSDFANSSTKSEITLDFTSDREPPAHGGGPVFLDEADVGIEGVEPIRPVLLRPRDHDGSGSRYLIEAGPPVFDVPVVITIRELLFRSTGGNEMIEGPWSLAVPPKLLTQDPVDTIVELHETVEADGISVTVNDVRFSSEEVLVSYTISTDRVLAEEFSPLMEFPDGEIVGGDGGAPADTPYERLRDHIASFPPLPDGVTEFDIRIGPFLTPSPGGELIISPPDASVTSTPGSYPIESRVESEAGDQTLLADELVVLDDDRFRIHLRPNPDSAVQMAGLSVAEISLEDDLGNMYALLTRGVGFGQTEDRRIFFREDLVIFDGPIHPDATELIIRVSQFAILLPGPWDFHVDIAAEPLDR